MTAPAFPITLDTDAARESWVLNADGGSYLVFSEGTAWIAYQTEDGDWFATRPAWEDDLYPDGTFPDGVTHSFEGLALPLTIAASAEMPVAADPVTETRRVLKTLDPSALFTLRDEIHKRISDGEHPRLTARVNNEGDLVLVHPDLNLEFYPEDLIVVNVAEEWTHVEWTHVESADVDTRSIKVAYDHEGDFETLSYAVEFQGQLRPVRLPEGWTEI